MSDFKPYNPSYDVVRIGYGSRVIRVSTADKETARLAGEQYAAIVGGKFRISRITLMPDGHRTTVSIKFWKN